MEFDELIELLRGGGDGIPPTIYDDLLTTHHASVDSFSSASEAIATRDARIAELQTEISVLKTKNYDLIMAGNVNENGDTDLEDSSDDPIEIDDLFDDESEGE